MATMASPTTAAVYSGIGSSSGMAAQVKLPNILVLLRRTGARVDEPDARVEQIGLRAGSRRQLLCGDLLEQPGIDRSEGEWPPFDALPGEGDVARGVEGRADVAYALDPGGELVRWRRLHAEMHVREAIAAEVARLSEEGARRVRAQVQLRRHAVHRVDHAAELRDEERAHHARRRQGEMDR